MALVAVCLAGAALAGCSLPGRAFPGGPSPWLPGGAPGAVYGEPPATSPTPVPATAGQVRRGGAGVFTPLAASARHRYGKQSVKIIGLLASRPQNYSMIGSLLVVCTGNICRSPMAAALFTVRASENGKTLDVASAGTAALIGHPPPAEAIELMDERGLDIRAHRARQITGEIARRYDLILVMERIQQRYIESNWPIFKGRIHRLGESRGEDVSDPYRRPREDYAESLAQIEDGVADWMGVLS